VLCPGNIATAGWEWVGTVTRLGSTYHGELRRLLGRAPYPMPAASRPEQHAEVRRARQLDKAETRETNTPC
jgi:hypothetical protein